MIEVNGDWVKTEDSSGVCFFPMAAIVNVRIPIVSHAGTISCLFGQEVSDFTLYKEDAKAIGDLLMDRAKPKPALTDSDAEELRLFREERRAGEEWARSNPPDPDKNHAAIEATRALESFLSKKGGCA